MLDSTGAGGAVPWFFLSYAHRRNSPSVDTWVARFHADLVRALLDRVGSTDPEAHGFMDVPGGSEALRRERRVTALSRCRVLVALCSPDYFTDLECHSEWTAFHQRLAPGGSPRQAVVPVLWERLWTDDPGRAGLDRRALARQYGADGLRAALTRPRLREEYANGVERVAEAVHTAAEQVDLAAGAAGALECGPRPWPDHPLARSLRINVLAYRSRDALPPGCDATRYGDLPQDWLPYGAADAAPVAELAGRLVLERNWHVTSVDDFEETAGKESESYRLGGPELLLLDRWALRSTRLRDLLLTYNRNRRHPLAVMVPWNPRIPGAQVFDSELQELTLTTLDRALGRPKPDFAQLRRGIPDASSFADLLPKALEQARQAFFAQRR
ncbi:TIR-like protein FxsC [Streptacidiphilus sp. PAMC 29251]